MSPLSPAIMEVKADDVSDKFMMWPLEFQQPGEDPDMGQPLEVIFGANLQ